MITSKVFYIENIPCVLYGKPSKGVYLYVHGQHSCKEAAEKFASIVNTKGWQVLAMDLPEHGERKGEKTGFYAWNVVPELKILLEYAKGNWRHIGLRAHSIGSYFSMMSYQGETFENVQLVSPILDMEKLCDDMMMWACVNPLRLEKEKFVKTDFGQILSWEEYCYAKENPVVRWDSKTVIMYGAKDNLTTIDTVQSFASKFGCRMKILENGEHWFHTIEQLAELTRWTEEVTPAI